MLSQEQIQELDSDFLNIDAFFANNDDDQDGACAFVARATMNSMANVCSLPC